MVSTQTSPDSPGQDPPRSDPHPEPKDGRDRPGWARWEAYAFLEVAALCGMAVTQPLLDVLGRSPDFFIFHGAGMAEVLLLVAAVTVLPMVLLWGIGLPVRFAGPRARRVGHALLLGVLFAVLAIQVGKAATPLRGIPLVAVATLAGAALVAGYLRYPVPRQVLRFASIGPLVFVALFVFGSASSVVVKPAGSGSAGATGPAGSDRPRPPVVVLVLDEFPLMSLLNDKGEIDAERVPNFARLAAGSTWYRNATAVSGTTTYAVPAMLTGRYPTDRPDAPHFSRYPDNLFTLLGGEYHVQAWENVTQLCPPQHCRGRPSGPRGGLPTMLRESATLLGKVASPWETLDDVTASFQEPTLGDEIAKGDRDPDVGPEFRMNRLAENQPARFTEFLDALDRDDDGPTLRFLHLLMPHSPWLYLPSGVRYEGAPQALPYDGQWWARLAYQRHLHQVGYTDRLLGEALRALEETGRYDESLIVVTSDHGDAFSEGVSGRAMDDAQRAAAELAWVPLFIKEPGQRDGRVDDRNWEHVDLLPTLADYLGVTVPWRTDGISALGEPRQTADKRFDRSPGESVTIDGATHFATVRQGPAARPVLAEIPELALTGRAVADFTVTDGGPPATLTNLAAFRDVRPDSGSLPALLHGSLPGTVRPGTPIAVALNGRIGAVALAVPDQTGTIRLVALIPDESLFVAGPNHLELFEVLPDGAGLRRLPLAE